MPPHVGLHEEVAAAGWSFHTGLATAVRERRFGLAHEEDALVQEAAAAAESVIPYALYIDGVSFPGNDSIVGFWIHNLHKRPSPHSCTPAPRSVCLRVPWMGQRVPNLADDLVEHGVP